MRDSNKRLIGWIVSYGLNQMGFSYELREGRSFVSTQQVGDGSTALTLHDDTVSTPHAVIQASGADHSVLVLDVFSQHGSFLSREGFTEEMRINGPVQIQHGDWIRIGARNRFQVCLLDGSNN